MTAIKTSKTNIPGALLIEPSYFADERGFFSEVYVESKYKQIGIRDLFVQDNLSWSRANVLRGLHGDSRLSKLVQVLFGRVYDVIVDARPNSPTCGTWEAFHLDRDNRCQLYIPAGCLHGFLVLSDFALVSYKQSAEYDRATEISVRWDDPQLEIAWPLKTPPQLSQKDRGSPLFRDLVLT